MRPPRLPVVFLAAVLAAGCSRSNSPQSTTAANPPPPPPKPAMVLVPENEQSRHFKAVSSQLELGGTLFAYADIDGDALKAAGMAQNLFEQLSASQPMLAPVANQDYKALAKISGLDGIKAFGLSSVPDGTGFFRNRVFLYTPDGRTGLLAAFGGTNATLAHTKYAPANADYYFETDVDMPALYQTVLDLTGKVGGDTAKNALQQQIDKASTASEIAIMSLINGLKGHVSFTLRFEGTEGSVLPLPIPPPGLVVPKTSFLLRIDGAGNALAPALTKSDKFERKEAANRVIFQLKPESDNAPFTGLLFVVEDNTFILASSQGFLDECAAPKATLGDSQAFKDALAKVGGEGNAVQFATPHFYQRIHDLTIMNPDVAAQLKGALKNIASEVVVPDHPTVAVRTNLADGILLRSYEVRSLKKDIVRASFANPVVLGLVAALAIPAFQKVKQNSETKEVYNNLQKVSVASAKYFAATGKTTVRYEELVNAGYIEQLQPLAGENYRTLIIAKGRTLIVRLGSGQIVSFRPASP